MRRKSFDRLNAIAEAALTVFTARGYRQTQMSDVAAEAGVSAGSLYGYAENKEALLKLAFVAAAGRLDGVTELPLASGGLDEIAAFVAALMAERMTAPVLVEALGRGDERPFGPELSMVLRELFDLLAANRRLIWLLDRCGLEPGPIGAYHLGDLKTPYLDMFGRYLARRLSAEDGPQMQLVARGLLELTAWFSMHRHRDPLVGAVDDDTAFAVVERLFVDGLLAGRG